MSDIPENSRTPKPPATAIFSEECAAGQLACRTPDIRNESPETTLSFGVQVRHDEDDCHFRAFCDRILGTPRVRRERAWRNGAGLRVGIMDWEFKWI